MAGSPLEIRTPQDLLHALVKAKRIEEAFEEVLHWQGFLTIQDQSVAETLEMLVRDSETHGRMVESLIKMVEPVPSRRDTSSPPITIDGEDELQLLQRLLEGEDLAYYVYSTILDALSRSDLVTQLEEQKVAEMRRILGELGSAEKRHRELVSQLLAARNTA